MNASDFVDVCDASELPPGARRTVTLGDVDVALLNVDGALYALDNNCPHRGGPLCQGDLEGLVLHCPLHAWPFDLRTGQCTLFTEAKVRIFDVRVVDGRIQIARFGRFN